MKTKSFTSSCAFQLTEVGREYTHAAAKALAEGTEGALKSDDTPAVFVFFVERCLLALGDGAHLPIVAAATIATQL